MTRTESLVEQLTLLYTNSIVYVLFFRRRCLNGSNHFLVLIVFFVDIFCHKNLASIGHCTQYSSPNWGYLILELTGFFQDIDYVQVLFLLCAVGQTTATVLSLIIQVVLLAVVVMEVGEILADIGTIHPILAVEGVELGLMQEVLIHLGMIQVP